MFRPTADDEESFFVFNRKDNYPIGALADRDLDIFVPGSLQYKDNELLDIKMGALYSWFVYKNYVSVYIGDKYYASNYGVTNKEDKYVNKIWGDDATIYGGISCPFVIYNNKFYAPIGMTPFSTHSDDPNLSRIGAWHVHKTIVPELLKYGKIVYVDKVAPGIIIT